MVYVLSHRQPVGGGSRPQTSYTAAPYERMGKRVVAGREQPRKNLEALECVFAVLASCIDRRTVGGNGGFLL